MTDHVDLLRVAATFPCDPRHKQLLLEAADEIERLRNIVYQYRDDLEFPPSADSIQRRLKIIDDALEGK